jgi:hypothetical protein
MPTSTLLRKSLNNPEETRQFAGHGKAHVSSTSAGPVIRGHFQPGWKWSNDVKPIAKTDSCQAAHMGYVISGEMVIRMNDGTEMKFGPGDLMEVAPGHDAWIVGDDECVVVDWGGAGTTYAKQ